MSDMVFGDGVEPWQRAMMAQSRPHVFGRIVRSPWYPEQEKAMSDEKYYSNPRIEMEPGDYAPEPDPDEWFEDWDVEEEEDD